MSSSIEKIGRETWALFRDSVRDWHDETINEAVEDAIVKGIAITTAALYEAGVEDSVIINLLVKHWRIYENEATEVLRYERTVQIPLRN